MSEAELATRIFYESIARYEGRPFTPVMAVLMECAGNHAMRPLIPWREVIVAPWLDARGMLQVRFKRVARRPVPA